MNRLPTDLPATTAVSVTARPHGYFIAKEGLSLSRDSGESLNIIGFGLSDDASKAKRIAHFEFLERFWSFYPACSGMVDPKSMLPAFAWPDLSKQITIAASSVMLGFREKGSKSDATGLAYGVSIDDASERAVLELCERHVLARFWWEDDVHLRLFKTERLAGEGIVAEYYTVDEEPSVPFCLVTLKGKGSLWCVGSAMARTLGRAADKAFLEAVMVFDSMSRNQAPAYNSDAGNGRYERYVAGGFAKAEEQFLGKVTRQIPQSNLDLEREDPVDVTVLRVLGEGARQLFIAPIISRSDFSVVSAFCESSLKPADFRERHNNQIDPFF
jgi:hypothetical protein